MNLLRGCFAIALLSVLLPAVRAAETRPAHQGEIVMDAATGQVLFADHADEVSPPASITKLMTFLVVHDHLKQGSLSLTTPVTVTAACSRIGGTQVWLKEGEVFPVEELLYAMLIQSANDCAYALSYATAGTSEDFVRLMNERARELGMTHTVFHNPHGLPPSDRRRQDDNLTTPRDLAILCRYLVQHTDILKYTSIRERVFRPLSATARIVMRNHNHLLGKVVGVDGFKTGYTAAAGFCLAATAERQGRRLIVVVMGSPTSRARDLRVAELFDRGFAALPASPVQLDAPRDNPVKPVAVPAAPDAAPDTAPVIHFALPAN